MMKVAMVLQILLQTACVGGAVYVAVHVARDRRFPWVILAAAFGLMALRRITAIAQDSPWTHVQRWDAVWLPFTITCCLTWFIFLMAHKQLELVHAAAHINGVLEETAPPASCTQHDSSGENLRAMVHGEGGKLRQALVDVREKL